jgi:hypothetical protein
MLTMATGVAHPTGKPAEHRPRDLPVSRCHRASSRPNHPRPSRPRRATRSLPAVVRPLHAPGLLAGLSLRGPNGGALAPLGRRYLGGPRGMFM